MSNIIRPRKPRTRVGTLILGFSLGMGCMGLLTTIFRPSTSSTAAVPRSKLDTGEVGGNPKLRALEGFRGPTSDTATTQQKRGSGENNASTKDHDDQSKGWHDIHVFFGEEKGLKIGDDEKWFSQVHQDEVIVSLLGDNGYFIDLAANDAKVHSNTLALERFHGWNGLCVEPNAGYWYGLSHRKCEVVGALVGNKALEPISVQFRGVYGGIVGKMDDKLANRKREPKAPTEDRYTTRLLDILNKFNVPKVIDYLSLDVEGSEYLILQTFPWDQFEIKVMTIERPSKDVQDLIRSKGFLFLKDFAWWGETLWAHKSTGFHPSHPKIKDIGTEERDNKVVVHPPSDKSRYVKG